MSIKSKVFGATAALTLIGGLGAVGTFNAGTAGAATPICGESCLNFFSLNFGTYQDPSFVLDVLRQSEKAGQPIVLFRTASTDPAEDFTVAVQGYVSTFYQAGLVSSALERHYAGDFAFELEYSPYGVDSGLCMGTAVTAVDGSDVSLQPCGQTAKTVWILDLADVTGIVVPPPSLPAGPTIEAVPDDPFVPLINGSDTNFSHPYVLTYPTYGYPTDMPRPELITQTLKIDSHAAKDNNQEWGFERGTLP
jgi:hypothetical protein